MYGNAKVCTWDRVNLYNSTGWRLTGQTALLRGGPDGSLGHILEQEHPGLYEQDFVHQVWGYNHFPLSNKPWNFMSNLGFLTGGSPVKGN